MNNISQTSSPEDNRFGYVLAVYILYFATFVLPFTALVGLVLAYVMRGRADSWDHSHYTYQIRTFWIGILSILILVVVMTIFFLLSFPVLFEMFRNMDAATMSYSYHREEDISVVFGMFGAMALPLLFMVIIGVWLILRCVTGLIHYANKRPVPKPLTYFLSF